MWWAFSQSCGCYWKRQVDPKKKQIPIDLDKLEHILRKQCSCWARPVITSRILEDITFWQPSTAQSNSPKKRWERKKISCSGMTGICLVKSLANTLWLQLNKKNKPLKYLLKRARKNRGPFGILLERLQGGFLEGSIRNYSSTKDLGNRDKKHSTKATAQLLEEPVDSKVKINAKETFNMFFPPIIPIEDMRNVHP